MAARTSTRLIVANWKLNPTTVGAAKELFFDIRKCASRLSSVETVVAAPYVYLAELRKLMTGTRTHLGAQDVFWETSGTYTGEVSAPMLASVDVSYVIVGHSERRAMGEDDAAVSQKAAAAIAAKLTPIVCVGEAERDGAGKYLSVLERQIRTACAEIPASKTGRLVIAYEPLWAISAGDGKGQTATAQDVHEMELFIRKILIDMYERTAAARVRVLYGGSVNSDNAEELLAQTSIDGFLVGGASLRPDSFADILRSANTTPAHA